MTYENEKGNLLYYIGRAEKFIADETKLMNGYINQLKLICKHENKIIVDRVNHYEECEPYIECPDCRTRWDVDDEI